MCSTWECAILLYAHAKYINTRQKTRNEREKKSIYFYSRFAFIFIVHSIKTYDLDEIVRISERNINEFFIVEFRNEPLVCVPFGIWFTLFFDLVVPSTYSTTFFSVHLIEIVFFRRTVFFSFSDQLDNSCPVF